MLRNFEMVNSWFSVSYLVTGDQFFLYKAFIGIDWIDHAVWL